VAGPAGWVAWAGGAAGPGEQQRRRPRRGYRRCHRAGWDRSARTAGGKAGEGVAEGRLPFRRAGRAASGKSRGLASTPDRSRGKAPAVQMAGPADRTRVRRDHAPGVVAGRAQAGRGDRSAVGRPVAAAAAPRRANTVRAGTVRRANTVRADTVRRANTARAGTARRANTARADTARPVDTVRAGRRCAHPDHGHPAGVGPPAAWARPGGRVPAASAPAGSRRSADRSGRARRAVPDHAAEAPGRRLGRRLAEAVAPVGVRVVRPGWRHHRRSHRGRRASRASSARWPRPVPWGAGVGRARRRSRSPPQYTKMAMQQRTPGR
jgi:hypothetical protein